MAIKICSYHKCDNYVLDGVPSGNFTIFGFPKNENRRKEWILLGNVPTNNVNSRLFMCSDHFESKYICDQSRRKILIGQAKPIPYTVKSILEATTKEKEIKIELEVGNSSDDMLVESTTINSDDDRNAKCTRVFLNGKRSSSECGSDISSTKKQKLPLISNEINSNPKVKTFIYNGEEYVQMPMTYYMEEKNKQKQELTRYKDFVKQIAANLTNFINDS